MVLFVLGSVGQANAVERRAALVIGNGDYVHHASLRTPVEDATDIAALLSDTLGFETVLHTDIDRESMADAVRDFGERATDVDIRLFYFAGYGSGYDGTNYLLPVDADIGRTNELPGEALDTVRVMTEMNGKAGGVNVILLDAGYDFRQSGFWSIERRGLVRLDVPPGSLILYSTAPGKVVDDRDRTFTRHLVRSLSEPGMNVDAMAQDVRVAVMKETGKRQVPWLASALARSVSLASPGESGREAVGASSPERAESFADEDYGDTIVDAYRAAAEGGDALAQSRLGFLHETGRFVPQDKVLAREWYERAAAQDEPSALVNLGVMYARGDGVATDEERAFALFERAAGTGHAAAQLNLGMLYQFGDDIDRDPTLARDWYAKAAGQGSPEAATALGDLYSHGHGVRVDHDVARGWYLRAAAFGSAAAQSELGYAYEQGVGVARDYEVAVEWFSRSAAQGYPRGLYNLGEMYEEGKGVAVDRARATELYARAAAAGDETARAALERLDDRTRAPLPSADVGDGR